MELLVGLLVMKDAGWCPTRLQAMFQCLIMEWNFYCNFDSIGGVQVAPGYLGVTACGTTRPGVNFLVVLLRQCMLREVLLASKQHAEAVPWDRT